MFSSILSLGKSALSGIAGKAGSSGLLGKLGAGASNMQGFIQNNSDMIKGVGGGIAESVLGIKKGGDVASNIVSGGLSIASKIPGPIGWVGKALKFADNLLAKKMNVSQADIDDTVDASAGFEGIQVEEGDLNNKINKENSKGGFVKLGSRRSRERLKRQRSDIENRANIAAQELSQGQEDLANATESAGDITTQTQNALNNSRQLLQRTAQFKKGGQINVIVDGKLHAHKHGMNDLDGLEDITKKGVPVIIEQDGGKIEQVAEFETGEVVFSREVIDKLDKLRDENTTESKIEAGKLITYELLNNTKDNSEKILETVE